MYTKEQLQIESSLFIAIDNLDIFNYIRFVPYFNNLRTFIFN